MNAKAEANWKYNVSKKICQLTKVVFRLHCETIDRRERYCYMKKKYEDEIEEIKNLAIKTLENAQDEYNKLQKQTKDEYEKKFQEFKNNYSGSETELQKRIESYKSIISDLMDQIGKLNENCKNQSSNFDEATKSIQKTFKSKLKSVEKNYQAQVDKIKSDYQLKIDSEQKKIQEKIDELNKKSQQEMDEFKENLIKQNKNNISNLEKEVSNLKNQIKSLNSKISGLKKEKSTILSSNEKLKEENAELQAKIDELNSKIQELLQKAAENDINKDSLTILQQKYEAKIAENQQLDSKYSDLMSKYENAGKKYSHLHKKFNELEKTSNEYQNLYKEAKSENEKLELQIKSLQDHIAELENQKDKMPEIDIEGLNSEISDLKGKNADLQSQLSTLSKEKEKREIELSSVIELLQKEIETLKKELEKKTNENIFDVNQFKQKCQDEIDLLKRQKSDIIRENSEAMNSLIAAHKSAIDGYESRIKQNSELFESKMIVLQNDSENLKIKYSNELNTMKAAYEQVLSDHVTTIHNLQSQLNSRPNQDNQFSIDENFYLAKIKSLEEALADRTAALNKMYMEAKQYQNELIQRETSYNKIFNSTPEVGVLNLVESRKKRDRIKLGSKSVWSLPPLEDDEKNYGRCPTVRKKKRPQNDS